jgi:hypothetical protein
MWSQRLQIAMSAALSLLAAGFWLAGRAGGQTEIAAATVWEFATVEALPEYWEGAVKRSPANICYHTRAGCRWETIRVSVDRWGVMVHDGVAAATARLGERGWEVIGATSPSESARTTVLLKRIRPAESGQ